MKLMSRIRTKKAIPDCVHIINAVVGIKTTLKIKKLIRKKINRYIKRNAKMRLRTTYTNFWIKVMFLRLSWVLIL